MKFLESELFKDKDTEADSLFHLIPAPMESSVSYGSGTAAGPQAILEASDQLEVWDNFQASRDIESYLEQYDSVLSSGIYTAPPVDCKGEPETVIGRIEEAVARALSFNHITSENRVISDNKVASDNIPLNAIPVLLGGEHTVTLGALRALKKYFVKSSASYDYKANCDCRDSKTNPDSTSYSSNPNDLLGNIRAPFGIIQIDAHADLRESYQGSGLSHACVMRRAVDDLNIPLFQIGVRAISYEEVAFRREKNIPFIDAKDIYSNGVKAVCDSDKLLPVDFPKKIYITLDVDGLDPSVIRATGTPVPGGLGWYDTLTLLEKIISKRDVVGFDLVELAPVVGDHASDFAAAQLIYSVMGMVKKQRH